MIKSKNEKAITLIALVITIIVLLILAGATIAVLTGENGLLNRTKEAKATSQNATIEENTALSDYETKIETVIEQSNRQGTTTKELLYSNAVGYNSTIEPITLSKPWTEYSELMIIGAFADSTDVWGEKHISKELLEIANQSNDYVILSDYYNFYMNIKITDESTIQCNDFRSPTCIKYIYGIK